MHQTLVEAIVGGVQKGGTTSLFRYLQEHPQLHPPAQKELHFFDEEGIDWRKPDYGLLHRAFGPSPGNRKAFEATPIYLFWPPSLPRIRAYNPGIRLIFIFRDPIERAWSNWKMEITRNRENLPFHAAIREGRQRLQNCGELDRPWRLFSYVERGMYAGQLRKALELFPREQMLFIRSNDLKRDHQNTLRKVTDFLEIDPFPPVGPRSDHRTRPVNYALRAADIEFLRTIYHDDVKQFAEISGLSVDDWPTIDKRIAIPN